MKREQTMSNIVVNRVSKCLRCYIASVAMILIATSFAKLYSATGTAKVLDIPEGLLPMTNRQALIGIGLVEILSSFYFWWGSAELVKLIGIAWLGGNFLLYRVASV